tara:strand:- start:968 stop:1327 length:360 start_codon:yes stop_codon:yes gene_type:complete
MTKNGQRIFFKTLSISMEETQCDDMNKKLSELVKFANNNFFAKADLLHKQAEEMSIEINVKNQKSGKASKSSVICDIINEAYNRMQANKEGMKGDEQKVQLETDIAEAISNDSTGIYGA